MASNDQFNVGVAYIIASSLQTAFFLQQLLPSTAVVTWRWRWSSSGE